MLALALTYFLVANPIGNTPTIMAFLKNYDFDRQRKIVTREGFFSLIIALIALFCGDVLLSVLHISDYALAISGGFILFTVALQMIFHKPELASEQSAKQEPFLVPIATPLVTGPGLMSTIMITGRTESTLLITCAIFIAFTGVISIMVAGPYLQRIIGKQGMAALERVMGMVLCLISMNMILKGAFLYAKTLTQTF